MQLSLNHIFVFVLSLCTLVLAADKTPVTLIASGEMHGMVLPCDCPVEPGGGMAFYAGIVSQFRKATPVLALDAGGFCAGGMYDPYTQGRAADSVRSISMIKAMGATGFAAVAIGDDDLLYGATWLKQQAQSAGLPLVCVNAYGADGKRLVAPFKIVMAGGVRFGITAVITEEKLFPFDKSITTKPPIAELGKIWKALCDSSDYQIILSHSGEEGSLKLFDSFPNTLAVVNGHRKTSTDPVLVYKQKPIMQFGFLSKELSVALFNPAQPSRPMSDFKWVKVNADVAPDSVVKNTIHNVDVPPVQAMPLVDLYMMSQCPYGREALRELLPVITSFPGLDWHIWFIGTVQNDTVFTSLHGKEEINEELLWLAVQNVYPEKWSVFLSACVNSGLNSREIADSLQINVSRLNGWIKTRANAELALHYERSMRLSIDASPTLVWNNKIESIDISTVRLSKKVCQETNAFANVCDTLPECLEDTDCKQPRKDGHCVAQSGKGKCVFSNAQSFTLTIVVPDSSLYHPEESAISTTIDLFPGAIIKKVSFSSPQGLALSKKLQCDALPAYLFDKTVQKALSYSRIESGLVGLADGFTFKNGIMPKNYLYKRPVKPKTVRFIIDPLFPDAAKTIGAVLHKGDSLPGVEIVPAFFAEVGSQNVSVDEKLRQEEAVRWITLHTLSPLIYTRYLKEFQKRSISSYWFIDVQKSGMPLDTLLTQIALSGNLVQEYSAFLQEIDVRSPVTALINNREVVAIQSMKELDALLGRLK